MAKAAFMLAAAGSGSGKTTFACGLMTALRRQGFAVQPFKVGPDYIDPMYHTALCGRPSRNLDSVMLTEETLRHLFNKNAADADVAVIEGVMGLFDGLSPKSIYGSSADIARILDVPVLLLVNARGMALSVAALVNGFRDFAPGVKIAGVLLNNVKSAMLFRYLKEIIETNCRIPVLGWLPHDPAFALSERHLGLYCSGEYDDLTAKFGKVADCLLANCDWPALLAAAAYTPKPAPEPTLPAPLPHPVRLGIARDAAFNFYYQDSIDLMERLGAAIVPFSPLADAELPPVDAVYLGGGYPELHAAELEANASFRADIAAKLAAGLPCYAECGGFIYLGRSLTYQNETHQMAGFFPFDFAMTDRLQHFGYMQAEIAAGTPLSGDVPGVITGHEFHYTKRVDGEDFPPRYQVSKPGKNQCWQEGYQQANTLGGYPHFNFWANPQMAKNLLLAAVAYQQRSGN